MLRDAGDDVRHGSRRSGVGCVGGAPGEGRVSQGDGGGGGSGGNESSLLSLDGTLDSMVGRLSATRCKQDGLSGRCTNGSCDLLACMVHTKLGCLTEDVR